MKTRTRKTVGLCCALPALLTLLLPSAAFGATLTLTPTEDLYISEHFPSPTASQADMVIGTQGIRVDLDKNHGLIRFGGLSQIPAGATITSVKFQFTVTKSPPSPPADFRMHRLLKAWDATSSWVVRLNPDQNWADPGGAAGTDFAADNSAAQMIGGPATYTFESTPALIADVDGWVKEPASNLGWLIKPLDEVIDHTARRIGASEGLAPAPSLEVSYEPPPIHGAPLITIQPQSQTLWAGSNFMVSVTVAGDLPFTYQWRLNGTNLQGASAASLVLTNVQLEDAGEYTVAVTNFAGYAISDPATLTVLASPLILGQPPGQVGYWGKDVTFRVSAMGTPPLTYLWYVNDFPILWATNTTLTLTNLELTAGGDYWVVVCNSINCVTSAPSRLVVNPAGISLGLYPGVTVDGVVGKSYGIQYTTDVTQTSSWTTLTNLTLTRPVQLWVDTGTDAASGEHPKRFYRVIPIP